MKIKKYTNGAWTDLDKPVKKFDTYTDEATTLPLTIQTSATDAVENYQVYGANSGVGEETENVYRFYGNGYYDDYMTFQPNAVDQCSYVIPVTDGDVYTISYNVPSVQSGMSERMYLLRSPTSIISEEVGIITTTGHRSHSITMADESDTVNYFCIVIPATATEVMLTKGSTAPASYIPHGYKIPILNTSGVTENLLIDNPYKTNYYIDENGQETAYSNFNIYATETLDTSLGEYSFYFATYDGNSRVRIHGYSNGVWQQQITFIILTNTATITKPQGIDEIRISCANSWTGRTLVKGSTPPDHYIPHRYESNYDLFIGDSKLYEDEYLDYGEQKVYKNVSGVLTPTDPPAPFPALSTYIGENNLSVDTTIQPEKVAVEYEGWKGVGDVEKYQNGEWSDNNGT